MSDDSAGPFVPDWAFSPGSFLGDELDFRDWSRAEFAKRAGLPQRVVIEILQETHAVTPDISAKIGAALGCSEDLFLNLEIQYQLAKARIAKK